MKTENCKMTIANLSVGHRAPSSSRHRPAQSFSHNYVVKLKNNLQFSFCNFHFSIRFTLRPLLFALCSLLLAICSSPLAQTITDKIVATVTNGSPATPDLITYSELLWPLILAPSTPFSPRLGSEQLNKASRTSAP